MTEYQRALDFAVRGDAWFAIETPAGFTLTRDGRFTLTENGDLVTLNGLSGARRRRRPDPDRPQRRSGEDQAAMVR
jgi:flagellar basal body rod protein FlgG